jgi:hypothetical protein
MSVSAVETSTLRSPEVRNNGILARSLSTSTTIAPGERSNSVAIDRGVDPLGLSLLYSTVHDHVADIIFIHGLGGSSRMTWSKHRRLDLFWPLEWLPKDEDLKRARIFTFGYNAKFKSSAQSSSIGIADFSKNLLFDMRFGRDDYSGSFNLGKVWRVCRTKVLLVDRRVFTGSNYIRGALHGRACLQKGWSVLVCPLYQWLNLPHGRHS